MASDRTNLFVELGRPAPTLVSSRCFWKRKAVRWHCLWYQILSATHSDCSVASSDAAVYRFGFNVRRRRRKEIERVSMRAPVVAFPSVETDDGPNIATPRSGEKRGNDSGRSQDDAPLLLYVLTKSRCAPYVLSSHPGFVTFSLRRATVTWRTTPFFSPFEGCPIVIAFAADSSIHTSLPNAFL